MHRNGRRVLVVDDDVLIRKLLETFLSFHGYKVQCASNAKEALKLIATENYDVLITDYAMPEVNGIELTKKIRSIASSLPIIGISGTAREQEFMGAGANFFMEKPIALNALKETLEKAEELRA